MDITAATRAPLKEIKSAASELLDQAADVGERLGRTANDALKQSKRALGRLQDSTEDILAETKQEIRKRPLESLVIAVAAGAGLGLVIGLMLRSRKR